MPGRFDPHNEAKDGVDRESVPLFCPECILEFKGADRFEQLRDHIEMHRPLSSPTETAGGRIRRVLCNRGCGRWLPIPKGDDSGEAAHHQSVCTGSTFFMTKIDRHKTA